MRSDDPDTIMRREELIKKDPMYVPENLDPARRPYDQKEVEGATFDDFPKISKAKFETVSITTAEGKIQESQREEVTNAQHGRLPEPVVDTSF